jgi:hypothetical protein
VIEPRAFLRGLLRPLAAPSPARARLPARIFPFAFRTALQYETRMTSARRSALQLVACLLLAAWPSASRSADSQPPPRVHVILWFDTEDYLLPADDDAAKRLAEMLSERGIRATFKVVGEKARVLERRGRNDVIAALKKHAIGYHANYHSVHPTPTEYLADCGWLDGVAEFARREGGGAADVRRIFGVPTLACYGQPGSSWASQAIGALARIGVAPSGVPCYVDEGTHVGLNEKPFWYAGALNVYHMGGNYTRMELHDPAAVAPAKMKFASIAERLAREDGGGLVSIFYHPCEWVHQEFWDGVNFARGRNPPREEWKAPRQRSPEETEAAFQRFAGYIDYIRSVPGVDFVTASDLPELYPDPLRGGGATELELDELARRLLDPDAKGLNFQMIGGKAFSAADQFELFTLAANRILEGQPLEYPLPAKGLLGPDGPPPASRQGTRLDWPAFREAARDALDFIQKEGRVPARVFIGPDAVPPADFLAALAAVCQFHRRDGGIPRAEGVALGAAISLVPARYVARDTPDLFGGWVIHRAGFRAPQVMEVARLQAWTLKPAVRAGEKTAR